MRLIDADVIKIPKGFFEKVDNVPKFYDWLDDQPTVDPVKHGRWTKIGHIENTWLVSKCSECGYQTIDAGNYCPNCGARMDLNLENEDHHE